MIKKTSYDKGNRKEKARGLKKCGLSARRGLPSINGASQGATVVKNLPINARDVRDVGPLPGLGRSPGGGHGNPLCSWAPHSEHRTAFGATVS